MLTAMIALGLGLINAAVWLHLKQKSGWPFWGFSLWMIKPDDPQLVRNYIWPFAQEDQRMTYIVAFAVGFVTFFLSRLILAKL